MPHDNGENGCERALLASTGRRVAHRHEYHPDNVLGVVHLNWIAMLLNCYV
jgi:hypothetical protein